ncbi:hypothetical protein [Aliarcobacter butzleri]|uniref:hypothetical protein n=1 Tax=Aliarcobacter butzleri TaxID=28197 RepID=UPI003AF6D7ED
MLNVEDLKNGILVGGVNFTDIKFENMEQLSEAVVAINRFNEEKNSFIRDSYAVAKTNAEAFISQWKIIHNKKVQLVLEENENKLKEQAKKTREALKLIPTLQKQHKEFIETISQIQLLDKYVLKDAYSYGSPYRRNTEDILKEVQYIIDNTVKASKGVK